MTPLKRPVARLVDLGRGPVVVTLEPRLLTFRHKGTRTTFMLPLERAYLEAMERHTNQLVATTRPDVARARRGGPR